MSRDVHRLSTQFDFFRLLSFYHSGCGFFINTWLVMLSVYAYIWVVLLMALTVPGYWVYVGPDKSQVRGGEDEGGGGRVGCGGWEVCS